MKPYLDLNDEFAMGNQPRKSMSGKSKKSYVLKRFELELDDVDKHRQVYKRAANKNLVRTQLHADQLIF